MPSPASSDPAPPTGPLRSARAPWVAADHGAAPVEWLVTWAETPEAGPGDDGARLVWAGPAEAAPREVVAAAAEPGVGRDAVRVTGPLLDHHVHGGAGVDLATSPVGDVAAWLERGRRAGVGTVIGSLPALPAADLASALDRLRPLWEEGSLAGVHLEGPFLSPARAGAHDRAALCTPASAAGHAVRAALRGRPRGLVRTMTLAPELAGSAALERELAAAGTVPCLGHTDADLPAARAALDRWEALRRRTERSGGRAPRPVVTHLFNAMRGFHHREPGPLPLLLDAARRGRLRLELIADDVHVSHHLVDLLLGDPALAPAVCLVSDAVAATGAAPGTRHRLGPRTIHAGHDAPRLGRTPASTGAEEAPLAGGRRSLADSVAALLRRGLDPDAVLRAATHVPRESLGAEACDGDDPARAGVVVWGPAGTRTVLVRTPTRVTPAG